MDRHRKFFRGVAGRETARRPLCVRFRDPLRLIAAHISVESIDSVTAAVHRFEESIAGRDYLIEVANVSDRSLARLHRPDPWRARPP